MTQSKPVLSATLGFLSVLLAACGGGAAPNPIASSAPVVSTAPSPSSAAAKPASINVSTPASAKPATSASAAPPAASAPAGAKPAASGSAAVSGGLLPIKMVYAQNAATQEVLFVAKEGGFWAKNGLDVAMTRVGGTAQVPAITSGEAQFANTGANEVTAAVINGAPLVMIGTLSDLPVFNLYANKSSAACPSWLIRPSASPPRARRQTLRRA
jgi:hypothetical protein